jgi:Fe-S cluster biosynthesis and repair protein YggX
MNTNDTRIEQFRKMSEADPTNELGHFSFGKALLEAGRPAEAVAPLRRALELNARLSKAHQLLGEAYDQSGRRGEAIETLVRGVAAAEAQGDRMPRDAMIATLREWGVTVPAPGGGAQADLGGESTVTAVPGFRCARCGRPGGQLAKPPFKGPLGEQIHQRVCTACWREWIAMGTKVINELGLVLSTPVGQQTYDQYMVEFLQLESR